MRASTGWVLGMSLDLGAAVGARADRHPRLAHGLDQAHALVERGDVVVQVGLGQAQRDVAVERLELDRELAAVLRIERRAQALVDDPRGARDRVALGLDVLEQERAWPGRSTR